MQTDPVYNSIWVAHVPLNCGHYYITIEQRDRHPVKYLVLTSRLFLPLRKN